MTLWVVGQINSDNYKEWEFQGVFDSEEKAVEACETETYFIAPAVLNETVPHEGVDWVGGYYPHASNE